MITAKKINSKKYYNSKKVAVAYNKVKLYRVALHATSPFLYKAKN